MVYASSKLVFTGFRGSYRDLPPAVETQKDYVEHEGDPNPCPEDDADLIRPDAEQMEEAIGSLWITWRKRSMVASHTFILCSQTYRFPSTTEGKRHLILSELWL